jgi:hypothetical protein
MKVLDEVIRKAKILPLSGLDMNIMLTICHFVDDTA